MSVISARTFIVFIAGTYGWLQLAKTVNGSFRALQFLGCWTEHDLIDVYILGLTDGKSNHTGETIRTDSNRPYIILVSLLNVCLRDMFQQFRFDSARANYCGTDIIGLYFHT